MFNTHYLENKNKTEANNSTWCSTTVQGNNSKAHTVLLLMSEAKKIHFCVSSCIRYSSNY